MCPPLRRCLYLVAIDARGPRSRDRFLQSSVEPCETAHLQLTQVRCGRLTLFPLLRHDLLQLRSGGLATTRGDGGGGENEAGGVCVGRAKTPSARPIDRGG